MTIVWMLGRGHNKSGLGGGWNIGHPYVHEIRKFQCSREYASFDLSFRCCWEVR